MDGQDWAKTVIRGAAPVQVTRTQLSAALPRSSSSAQAERKLADATDVGKLKKLSPASKQQLIQIRVGLKKNQTELNQMCSFPPNTIREIEAGRLTPTIGQLNTLNRILKTGLRLE